MLSGYRYEHLSQMKLLGHQGKDVLRETMMFFGRILYCVCLLIKDIMLIFLLCINITLKTGYIQNFHTATHISFRVRSHLTHWLWTYALYH